MITFAPIRRLAVVLAILFGTIVGAVSVASGTAAAASDSVKMMPITPERMIDTRRGTGGRYGKLGYNEVARWRIFSVPPEATAVTMNVTVTETEGGGYLTIWDCRGDVPNVSNLNYAQGDTKANQVTIALSPGTQEICIFSFWPTHIIVDIQAWYGATTNYTLSLSPIRPNRVLDSRKSGGLFAPYETRRINLSAIVPGDAKAVTFNLTTDGAEDGTFATVWPCSGTDVPTLSSLNTGRYQIRSNQVTVLLSANRDVCIYSKYPQHLIVDVTGAWVPNQPAGITNITPYRVFDTRNTGNPLQAGETRQIYPQRDHIIVGQWTITKSTGHGYQAVFPCNTGFENTSTINYVTNETTSVALYMDASKGGICAKAVTSGSHIILDVSATADIVPATQPPVITPNQPVPRFTVPHPGDKIPFRRNLDPELVARMVEAVGQSRFDAVAAQIDDLTIRYGTPILGAAGVAPLDDIYCENQLCELRVTIYIAPEYQGYPDVLAHEWAHAADYAAIARHNDFSLGWNGMECAADRVASIWRGPTYWGAYGPCDSERARAILAKFP